MNEPTKEINGRKFIVFPEIVSLSEYLADYLYERVLLSYSGNTIYSICLSGGNTPKLIFSSLASLSSKPEVWQNVIVSWGDERMVPESSSESNYGTAKRIFFTSVENVVTLLPIRGDTEIDSETERFAFVVQKHIQQKGGLPQFSTMLLGMGDDGHTASIFPEQQLTGIIENICGIAFHPVSGQKRISLTMDVINNSEEILIPVTGKNKAGVLHDIFYDSPQATLFPASKISKEAIWLIDVEAASALKW